MNRLQRSWVLLKSSLTVIARNKLLLVFPITIFLCTLAIIAFFLAPPILRPTSHSYVSAEHWQEISHSLFRSADTGAGHSQVVFSPLAMTYLAFLYLLSMFIATFCNVAFYHEILAALSGQSVSIARGVKFACSRLSSILMWSLFAGLVGLLIKVIEERMPLVGRIIGRIIGLAWSIAAVFSIPVIVREEQNANPIAVLRKSAGVLKQTWGEALIGYVGLSFVNGIIFAASFVSLLAAIAALTALHLYILIAVAVVGWLVGLFAWSYLTGVASHVYRGALFLYASEGIVAEPYNQEILDAAWKFRR
jgi:hypothetical protein